MEEADEINKALGELGKKYPKYVFVYFDKGTLIKDVFLRGNQSG